MAAGFVWDLRANDKKGGWFAASNDHGANTLVTPIRQTVVLETRPLIAANTNLKRIPCGRYKIKESLS